MSHTKGSFQEKHVTEDDQKFVQAHRNALN